MGCKMVAELRHIGIVAKDIDKTINFYGLLGFRPINCRKEDTEFISQICASMIPDLHTARLINEKEEMIEILYYHNKTVSVDKTLSTVGVAHLAFTVKDINLLWSRLSEAGAKFLHAPIENPERTVKVAFCIAPEGTFVELVELL